MSNAFEILGLPPGLVFSEETLRDAYREAGKISHPDAGGAEGEFSLLKEAFSTLSSPSRRLSYWLELRGIPANPRGVIDPEMMDRFARIGKVTQQAETVIRKREEAKSALVRAMLEGETQICREEVEREIAGMDTAIAQECAAFSGFETAAELGLEAVSEAVRNLAFLEKWRTGLRSCYSRLV